MKFSFAFTASANFFFFNLKPGINLLDNRFKNLFKYEVCFHQLPGSVRSLTVSEVERC
jgi:hypothetical protein